MWNFGLDILHRRPIRTAMLTGYRKEVLSDEHPALLQPVGNNGTESFLTPLVPQLVIIGPQLSSRKGPGLRRTGSLKHGRPGNLVGLREGVVVDGNLEIFESATTLLVLF